MRSAHRGSAHDYLKLPCRLAYNSAGHGQYAEPYIYGTLQGRPPLPPTAHLSGRARMP